MSKKQLMSNFNLLKTIVFLYNTHYELNYIKCNRKQVSNKIF